MSVERQKMKQMQFSAQEEARVLAPEKGSTLDSECHVRKPVSMSGFCLAYLHLNLSATGLASGPYPWDKDGKWKHIPSHMVHCDLQGLRATSVCDMFIPCHEASMPSTMKTFWTEEEKELDTLNILSKSPLDIHLP